jgi:predicted nuclease with TOPRIM domain
MNSFTFWNSSFWYFLVAVIGIATGGVGVYNVMRRNRLDASSSVMSGALELVEQLRAEVMRFRDEVTRLAEENDDLHGQVRRLSDENDALRGQLRRLEDRVYAAAGTVLPREELAHVLESRKIKPTGSTVRDTLRDAVREVTP